MNREVLGLQNTGVDPPNVQNKYANIAPAIIFMHLY